MKPFLLIYISYNGKKENHPKEALNIELPADIAEGVYSNLVMIAHSNSEFVLDFTRAMPGLPQPKVKARIIITPEHAKRFLAALQDNIKKYEDTHGTISTNQNQAALPMNFGGTMGEA